MRDETCSFDQKRIETCNFYQKGIETCSFCLKRTETCSDRDVYIVWARRVVFIKKGSRRVVLTKKRKCRLIDETCRLIVETCSLLVGTCRYISLCLVFSAQLAHSWLDFSGIIVYIHVDITYKKRSFLPPTCIFMRC